MSKSTVKAAGAQKGAAKGNVITSTPTAERTETAGTKHRQVKIQYDNQEAEVDEGISSLILEIWKASIDTMMSCQSDTSRRIWVCFPNALEAHYFISIVGEYDPAQNSLYRRIFPAARIDPDDSTVWQFATWPHDLNLKRDFDEGGYLTDERQQGPTFGMFDVSVMFLPSDLPEVMRLLRKHNRAGGGAQLRLSKNELKKRAEAARRAIAKKEQSEPVSAGRKR